MKWSFCEDLKKFIYGNKVLRNRKKRTVLDPLLDKQLKVVEMKD
jgi:hypothetical protein